MDAGPGQPPVASESVQSDLERLQTEISQYPSLLVAFSGGVDSSLLLKVAHDVLGDHVVAATVEGVTLPSGEADLARLFCEDYNIRHIELSIDELSFEGFAQNPPNRCYLCKREIFSALKEAACKLGIQTVAEGSNLDDMGDYRPGMKAVTELGIVSPLRNAGLTKKRIRACAKALGLKVWNKPSLACLASRFAYGETLTKQKFEQVDAAEKCLRGLGLSQVRVRVTGSDARIEALPSEFDLLIHNDMPHIIGQTLKELGFTHVSLDLLGYRTGSMNEGLTR
ncbi:MAG: ATP-dependent sacrificial sulfur transferase LarE [Coriobacteriales bacterium]|nr:ATP-dependent sacrificial sulfur transferase LarE [Coriobacteriales bacterium]